MLQDHSYVEAVLNRTFENVSDQDRSLFQFLDAVIDRPREMNQLQIDEVKQAGWSEEAVYDAITVCALFQFYNTWVDATGVKDLPAAGYEMAGKRTAQFGYGKGSSSKE